MNLASENASSVYFHPPGDVTKGAVLDVGLKCTHSCRFCYYSFLDGTNNQFQGMRRASFRTLDECKRILSGLKENGFYNFDYTGGEPSLHPHIVELTHYAHKQLGLKGRMITLGQFLMRKLPSCQKGILIEELLDAGLCNFLFSLHAVSDDLFKRITGESWSKLLDAMNYLDERKFSYTSNTTVFEWNYQSLPEIAEEVLRHNVYMHNFIIMNAYYEWNRDGKAFGVQAKYTEIFPYLKKAIDILESNHVAVNVRYAPLCTLRGYEKNLVGGVGVRYDPYEWMNKAGHTGGDPEFCASVLDLDSSGVDSDWIYQELGDKEEIFAKRGGVKVFPQTCRTCKARTACDGVDPNYLKTHGEAELRPYTEQPLFGPVPTPRMNYLPAFQVKAEQWTDMKAVVKRAFERDLPATGRRFPEIGVVLGGAAASILRPQTITPTVVRAMETGQLDFSPATLWIFLDSPQELAEELLETIAMQFEKYPALPALYTDAFATHDDGSLEHRRAGDYTHAMLFEKISTPVVAIRIDRLKDSEVALFRTAWSRGMHGLTNAYLEGVTAMHLTKPLAHIRAEGEPLPTLIEAREDARLVLKHPARYPKISVLWAGVMLVASYAPFAKRVLPWLDPRAGKRVPKGLGEVKTYLRGLRPAQASG